MTTYNSSMGGSIYQGAVAVTEDFTRIQGVIAGCGEASLLVILNAVKGVPTSPSELASIITTAAKAGEVRTTGVSSPHGLEQIAGNYGVSLQSGNWQTLLGQYAGRKPVIIGVSNATAFGGRDANVFGHYITVVGRTNDGRYIVSDPNSAESKQGQFIVYSASQIAQAHPFWAATPSGTPLASVNPANGIATVGTPQGFNLGIPGFPDLTNVNNFFGNLQKWADPLRLVKLIAGSLLLMIVVAALFFDGVFDFIVKPITGGAVSSGAMKAAGKAAIGAALA